MWVTWCLVMFRHRYRPSWWADVSRWRRRWQRLYSSSNRRAPTVMSSTSARRRPVTGRSRTAGATWMLMTAWGQCGGLGEVRSALLLHRPLLLWYHEISQCKRWLDIQYIRDICSVYYSIVYTCVKYLFVVPFLASGCNFLLICAIVIW